MSDNILELQKKNEELILELNDLKTKMKNYTNPKRQEKYYENNREVLLEKQRKKYHDKKLKEKNE